MEASTGSRAIAPGPERLILQWHLTERCNLRCSHCYQEDYGGTELSLSDLLGVIGQFRLLLGKLRERRAPLPFRGRVTITGGKPFVREDLLFLLEALSSCRDEFEFTILTNGTLIVDETADYLAELGPSYVQVSLEGGRETNDRVRGAGTFDLTVSALRRLVERGVPTMISFTAQRSNYREFPEVARLGVELGVNRIWADRMVPHGAGSLNEEPVLGPEETREMFGIMRRARADASRRFGSTEIYLGRALQFLVGGGTPYHCGAGSRLITLMPGGDVYPCRRMPVRVGNVLDTPLPEIWEEDGLLRELRDPDRVSEGCEECRHRSTCRGGLRCLSHAITGNPFVADPGCWLARAATGAGGRVP